MSGPEPTLAATAAFGRTSSQLSLSMRTSTPVASVKALVLAFQASSSPCDEGHPAQQAQRGARLGRVGRVVLGEGARRAEGAGGGEAGGAGQSGLCG